MWFSWRHSSCILTKTEADSVVTAISSAEQLTSAEIRVHYSGKGKSIPLLQEAKMVFEKLNMHATKERNGILIYLRIASREICVLGDEGIHQFVGQEYWDTVIQEMIQTIKNESLANGIVKGIELIGKQLSIYFPATEINPNELSNEISHD